MLKIYTIYKITNTINNKVYIGKTNKPNPINRWLKGHLYIVNKIMKIIYSLGQLKNIKKKILFFKLSSNLIQI